MTAPGIPKSAWLAAAALPANAASRDALLKAAGVAGDEGVRQASSVAQGASESAGKARGKRRQEPTKLEAKFAREVLDPMVAVGALDGYECEGMTLRLPNIGAVTPDYVGWRDGVPSLFEVKGTRVGEATVLRMKLHAAARPWLRWRIYARRDGAWRVHFDSCERRP